MKDLHEVSNDELALITGVVHQLGNLRQPTPTRDSKVDVRALRTKETPCQGELESRMEPYTLPRSAGAQAPSPVRPGADWMEFANMSFDAMAKVDLASRTVVWANNSFTELAAWLGGGNSSLGNQTLQNAFLAENVPIVPNRMFATFGSGPSGICLWSITKIIEPGIAHWVMHRPMQAPCPTQNSPVEPACIEGKPFPMASDHTDVTVKIKCGSSTGRWGIQMLWRKYGDKPLLKPASDAGSLVRQYYKCYVKDCTARLRIDVIKETGESVNTTATGKHTHYIEFVKPSDRDRDEVCEPCTS